MARELALEFSELGILVNIVSPTFIISSRNEHMLNTARFKKEYLRKIPLKKYATAKDVIKAILFLINNDNCLITGQNILVDGGYTIA